jgi:hypothetical protein
MRKWLTKTKVQWNKKIIKEGENRPLTTAVFPKLFELVNHTTLYKMLADLKIDHEKKFVVV